jgi:pilus assembly protein CpaE
VIDLDIQFGTVGASLGRSAKTTVVDLLDAGSRLDTEFIHSATIDSGRGFDVIVAPEPITPLESVNVDHLLQLLTLTRREYGVVLADLPANWTNWTLSTTAASTDVVLITELTIAGLRQAKRRLELFDSVGIPRSRIHVVVNRVEKRLFPSIGVEEVRQTLGHPVFAKLAADHAVLSSAPDQGLLAWEAHRNSKFASDISALAERLAQGWGA